MNVYSFFCIGQVDLLRRVNVKDLVRLAVNGEICWRGGWQEARRGSGGVWKKIADFIEGKLATKAEHFFGRTGYYLPFYIDIKVTS